MEVRIVQDDEMDIAGVFDSEEKALATAEKMMRDWPDCFCVNETPGDYVAKWRVV